jgi:hypothetical protein
MRHIRRMRASPGLDVVQGKTASRPRRGRRSKHDDVATRLEAAFRAGAADAIQQAHDAGLAVPVLDKADRLAWIHPDGSVQPAREPGTKRRRPGFMPTLMIVASPNGSGRQRLFISARWPASWICPPLPSMPMTWRVRWPRVASRRMRKACRRPGSSMSGSMPKSRQDGPWWSRRYCPQTSSGRASQRPMRLDKLALIDVSVNVRSSVLNVSPTS